MKIFLKFGLIQAAIYITWSLVIYITGLDTTYIHIGYISDYLVLLIPIIVTYKGLKADALSLPQSYTLLNGLKTGLLLNLVCYSIYMPFLIVYHTFINPEWLDYVLKLTETKLLERNVAPEAIKVSLETISKQSTISNHIISGLIFGVILIGGLISVISTLIIRRKLKQKQIS
ncbi:MAG: DUF4199 domain-containing protein [Bacteroidetes bacterium]|nr:DUF4199 domain-containing protein [Bacteroidota bacterium]